MFCKLCAHLFLFLDARGSRDEFMGNQSQFRLIRYISVQRRAVMWCEHLAKIDSEVRAAGELTRDIFSVKRVEGLFKGC